MNSELKGYRLVSSSRSLSFLKNFSGSLQENSKKCRMYGIEGQDKAPSTPQRERRAPLVATKKKAAKKGKKR